MFGSKIVTDEKRIHALLTRGVSEVIERAHLEGRLRSGERLRVKFGIDPTAPDLHLGHAVPLWKLREFQNLGHKAVLIIGDFTARIGDPSGRTEAREPLSETQIKANLKHYLAQAGRIINLKAAEVRYNSEWLAKLGLRELAGLLSATTAAQIMKREDFAKRIAADSDITMLETFYPLMQGYDSVAVEADVELGGHDQLLNLLMGRKVQRHYKMAEQDVVTFPLLRGLDGTKKMSKSVGNIIGLTESADDMVGKIMALSDEMMNEYFTLAAGMDAESGIDLDPRSRKMMLARAVAARYYDENAAEKAGAKWEATFSKKEINANDIPALKTGKAISALDLVMRAGVLESKSEARRLIAQGGVKVNDEALSDPLAALKFEGGEIVKIGKRHFYRIEV
jgi:tyrosyl-tRNA synthetase